MNLFGIARGAFAVLLVGAYTPAQDDVHLERHYQPNEALAYKMEATNQGRASTTRYEARVAGRVDRENGGIFAESFHWTSLALNGLPVPLTSASMAAGEVLSLDPKFQLSIPPLNKVQPPLIGPILDLLTFYADVQLAMRQPELTRLGGHVYCPHGTPNSWADGASTVFGQDAVDFDLKISSVERKAQTATLAVRHVPPVQQHISFPAPWMSARAGALPNNWAQVEKADDGGYRAEFGIETFDVQIQLGTL